MGWLRRQAEPSGHPILVVDENITILDILSHLLVQEGHEVLTAELRPRDSDKKGGYYHGMSRGSSPTLMSSGFISPLIACPLIVFVSM